MLLFFHIGGANRPQGVSPAPITGRQRQDLYSPPIGTEREAGQVMPAANVQYRLPPVSFRPFPQKTFRRFLHQRADRQFQYDFFPDLYPWSNYRFHFPLSLETVIMSLYTQFDAGLLSVIFHPTSIRACLHKRESRHREIRIRS